MNGYTCGKRVIDAQGVAGPQVYPFIVRGKELVQSPASPKRRLEISNDHTPIRRDQRLK